MKTTPTAPVLLILIAFVSTISAQQEMEGDDWTEVRPPETRIVIQMPSEPRHRKQVMTPTPEVEITQHQYVVTVGEEKHTAYFFNYHDLPGGAGSKAEMNQVLDNTVGSMVARVNGTLNSHEEFEYKNRPGRELVFKFSDREDNHYTFHSKIFLRDGRMYQLNVVSRGDNYSEDDADKFFKSFKYTSVMNKAPVKETEGPAKGG